MIIDISVACIAAAFVVLVIFLIICMIKFNKTSQEMNKLLHTTKKDLDEVSVEGLKLIKNLNETTSDVKKKLHALDFIFNETEKEDKKGKNSDLVTEVVRFLSIGFILYNRIKGGIKDYVK